MNKRIVEEIINGPRVIQILDKELVKDIKAGLSSRYDYVQEIGASDKLAEDIAEAAKVHTYHGSGMGKSKTVAVVVSDSSNLPMDIVKYLGLEWSEGISDFGSTAWNVDKLLLMDERPQLLLFAESLKPEKLGILKDNKVQPAVTSLNRFLLYLERAQRLIENVEEPIWFSTIIDGSGEDIYREILNCWFEMELRLNADERTLADEKYKDLQRILLNKINQYGFRMDAAFIKMRVEEMRKEYKGFDGYFSGIRAWSFIRSAGDWTRQIRSMFFFNYLILKNADEVTNKETADAIRSVCQAITDSLSSVSSIPKHEFKGAEEAALFVG